jgi:hypothetical protein
VAEEVTHRVTWEVDLDDSDFEAGITPEETAVSAAERAHELLYEEGPTRWVYKILDLATGKTYEVDLGDVEADEVVKELKT